MRPTIGSLFKGRPYPRSLFRAVRKRIGAFGPMKMEVFKTQVSFGRKKKFAWVWLPQMWNRKRGEAVIALTFKNAWGLIRDRRIAEATETSPGHWTHHVIIGKPADIDRQVMRWLRAAYDEAGETE